MRVLVIAPHMDDEVLGCAGIICKHKSAGNEVVVIFVAHRVYNHRHNKQKNKRDREQRCNDNTALQELKTRPEGTQAGAHQHAFRAYFSGLSAA